MYIVFKKICPQKSLGEGGGEGFVYWPTLYKQASGNAAIIHKYSLHHESEYIIDGYIHLLDFKIKIINN